ncbi:MAG: hypothetical protein ABL897_05380 [Hyphomicrobium sp.]
MTHADKLTAAELAAYNCAVINRMNLSRFVIDFQTSVDLFELLERGGGPPTVGIFGGAFTYYRMIAAKDGAMNIYHFGCSLEAIRHQLSACRSLQEIDRVAVRRACKLFRSTFPHAESVRHAIAHAGELNDTPAKITIQNQKNAFTGHGFSIGSGGQLIGALYERTYSIVFEGEVFSVVMDTDTLAKLNVISGLVYGAFSSPCGQT